jgi:hypothetical protein
MASIAATHAATPSLQAALGQARLQQARREADAAQTKAQDLRTRADQAEKEAQASNDKARDAERRNRSEPDSTRNPTYSMATKSPSSTSAGRVMHQVA